MTLGTENRQELTNIFSSGFIEVLPENSSPPSDSNSRPKASTLKPESPSALKVFSANTSHPLGCHPKRKEGLTEIWGHWNLCTLLEEGKIVQPLGES
jgi:hypothetical protein